MRGGGMKRRWLWALPLREHAGVRILDPGKFLLEPASATLER